MPGLHTGAGDGRLDEREGGEERRELELEVDRFVLDVSEAGVDRTDDGVDLGVEFGGERVDLGDWVIDLGVVDLRVALAALGVDLGVEFGVDLGVDLGDWVIDLGVEFGGDRVVASDDADRAEIDLAGRTGRGVVIACTAATAAGDL